MSQLPLALPMGDATPPSSHVWAKMALACIEHVARHNELVHVDDVARYAEETKLPRPQSMNQWGAVWLKAIRAGLIYPAGERRAAGATLRQHRHKHGRSYPVYQSKVYRP